MPSSRTLQQLLKSKMFKRSLRLCQLSVCSHSNCANTLDSLADKSQYCVVK